MSVLTPDFSIATPTYNALAKLRRCVGSVRGQTGVRWEHLVQDGQSADGTSAWLQAQAQSDLAMRPQSVPDQGMYDAINRAWSRSSGPILSWLNADEQYLPGTLALVKGFFAANPTVDVVSGDYLVADALGRAVALRREIPMRPFYVANSFLNTFTCTLFFRRRLWTDGVLRLDGRLRYAADKDLVLRLAAAGAKFAHLPEVLSVFGVDGSNLSAHAGMAREAEVVRLTHGGFRWKPLRWSALAARRVERLARGAYRPVEFRYRYALDEVPSYVEYHAAGLGGRYSLADTLGRAHRIESLPSDPATKPEVRS